MERAPNCGFFDPYRLYSTPRAEEYVMKAGSATLINGNIPSSYGIDLLEFEWDPGAQGKSVRITIDSLSDPAHEFSLELWKISAPDEEGERESRLTLIGEPESARTENGSITLEVNATGLDDFSSLGLVITRIDPYEKPEVTGHYTVRLLAE
jgi:hypothetical protein